MKRDQQQRRRRKQINKEEVNSPTNPNFPNQKPSAPTCLTQIPTHLDFPNPNPLALTEPRRWWRQQRRKRRLQAKVSFSFNSFVFLLLCIAWIRFVQRFSSSYSSGKCFVLLKLLLLLLLCNTRNRVSNTQFPRGF